MTKLFSLVMIMLATQFTRAEDWEQFNSSLCIEVTRSSGVFTCTGVAVSPELILTAAHCLEGEVKKVRIFTQETYSPQAGALEVHNFKLHPAYDSAKSRYRNDLAKIQLKKKLPGEIKIYPIHTSQILKGELFRFGFGERFNRNSRTVVSPTFRRLNLEEDIIELDDKFSKSGDSGGPIFVKNGQEIQLLAIHSTFSHGPEGQFSLNPILQTYTSWIFEN